MVSARHGLYLEDLSVGQAAEATRTVTAEDIDLFARVTGDRNPIHVDEAYAAATSFKHRIAHGMLGAGFISALLGETLPGPGAVYISQSLKFKRAVMIGDAVTTRAEVTSVDLRRGFVGLKTTCSVGGKTVTEGEAVVIVDKRS